MCSLITLLMIKLNLLLKILDNKISTATLHAINKHLSNFFYHNQMCYNYKLDENILTKKNILPTDPNENKTYHIL